MRTTRGHEFYIRIGDKCLRVHAGGDYLRVEGKFSLEIRQRIVTARGVIDFKVYSIRGGKKKVVYLYTSGVGIECNENTQVLDEVVTHNAHLRHVKTKIGGFVTVITSGYFVMDYLIISESEIAMMLSGKREVYIDKHGDEVSIYIV